jgi:hypothetical protein
MDQPLPTGYETELIESLVRSKVITNWETQDEPEHLKTIRNYLIRTDKQNGPHHTRQLLSFYQQILENNGAAADDSPTQIDLRLSGVVVKKANRLEICNRIYAQVFDRSWLERVLADLRPYSESLTAWLATDRQDNSRLLSGQALMEAQSWSQGKNLSADDVDFLAVSQKTAKMSLQKQRKRQVIAGAAIFLAISASGLAISLFSQVGTSQQAQVRTLVRASKAQRSGNNDQAALFDAVKAVQLLFQIKDAKPELRLMVRNNLRQSLRKVRRDNSQVADDDVPSGNLKSLVQQSCQELGGYLSTEQDLSPTDRRICDDYPLLPTSPIK